MNRGYRLSNRSKKFRYTWAVGLEGVSRLRGLRLWLVLAAAALAVLGTLSAPPPAEAQAVTLVANTGETAHGVVIVGGGATYKMATRFTTGANAHGYSIASVTVQAGGGTNASMPQLSIYSSSEAGTTAMPTAQPNAELFSFDPPATFGSGLQTFTAPAAGVTLASNTSYWIVVSGGSTVWRIRTNANAASHADSGSQRGWSIHGSGLTQGADSRPVVNTGASDMYGHLRISIQGEGHTTDQIPPTLVSATVDATGINVDVTFSESIGISGSALRDHKGITVTADGRQRVIRVYSVNNRVVRIVLRNVGVVRTGQSVVVTYTDPTEDDDAVAFQDAAGNDVASFTTGSDGVSAVVNNSTLVDTTEAGARQILDLAPLAVTAMFSPLSYTDILVVPDGAAEKAAFLVSLAASFALRGE